jgi:hypothetical protein
MPGYRITARTLMSQGLSEEVLREFEDLEAFATLDVEKLELPAEKVVFVLEDEDTALGAPLPPRR